MLTAKEQELFDALNPRALQESVEIITVEVVGSAKAPTIRVYIDTPDGVSFDELAGAQVWINDIMDDLDPFPGAYTLEVSSPGIDRPLRTPEHFERFKGERAHLKTKPVDGRSSWTGDIQGVTDQAVVLLVDEETFELPFEAIKKARLKGVLDFSSKSRA